MNNLPQKRTLFQIGEDAQALNDLLVELEGDVSDPVVAGAIDEWLNENGEALEAKLDGYAALIQERAALAKARKEEAKRLMELARIDENMASRLKERLQYFFEERGIEKTETARFKFSLANNGGLLPLLVSDEVSPYDVAEEYTKREFDTNAIREALGAGEVLAFARLGERGRSLRIR